MKAKTKKGEKNEMLNFTSDQLINMPESTLLHLTILYYELQHPEMKADSVIASELGITTQCLGNYKRGAGHVGYDGWKKLYELTKCQLIIDWKKARWTF